MHVDSVWESEPVFCVFYRMHTKHGTLHGMVCDCLHARNKWPHVSACKVVQSKRAGVQVADGQANRQTGKQQRQIDEYRHNDNE